MCVQPLFHYLVLFLNVLFYAYFLLCRTALQSTSDETPLKLKDIDEVKALQISTSYKDSLIPLLYGYQAEPPSEVYLRG